MFLLTLGIPSLRVFENPEPKRDFKTFLATRGQSLKESRVRGFPIEGIDQFLPASFPSLSLVLESPPFPCSPCSPYLQALMIGSPVHRRTCKLHTGNAHIPLLCSTPYPSTMLERMEAVDRLNYRESRTFVLSENPLSTYISSSATNIHVRIPFFFPTEYMTARKNQNGNDE